MSTFTKIFESDVGTRVSEQGWNNLNELYLVKLDNDTDRRLGAAAWLKSRIGGVEHENGSGLVAQEFSIVQRVGYDEWKVRVVYRPPILLPGDDLKGWDFAFSPSLSSINRRVDLDGKIIGPNVYQLAAGDAQAVPGELFHAVSAEGNTLDLIAIEDAQGNAMVNPEGLTATLPTATVSLSKTFTGDVQAQTFVAVQAMMNKLNSDTVLGIFGARTLKFLGMQYRSRPASDPNTRALTRTHDVALAFEFNPSGHQPVRVVELYTDESGRSSIVYDDRGRPVVKEYRLYDETPMNWLTDLF